MKPKDPVWSNFEVLENINSKEQKARCLNCNAMISARAPRLKSHVQKCGYFESFGPNAPKKQTFLEIMMPSLKSLQGEMDKYMLTIMVTFEQEYAIQKLFGRHGWEYSKITDEISPKKEKSVEKVSSEPQPPVNQQSKVNKTVTVPSSTSKIVTPNNDKVTKTAAVKISVISDVNNKLDNRISSEADPLGDDDHDEEGDEDDDYGGDTDTEHAEQSLESLGIVVKEEVDSEDDKTCDNHADNVSSSASNVKISGKGKRVAQTKVVTSNRKKRKLATCTVTSAEAAENVDRGERVVKLEQLTAEDQDIDDPLAVLETLPDIEHLSKVVSSETHDVETFLTGPSDVDNSGYSFTLAAYFCKDCQYTFPEEKYFTVHKRSGKCVFQCQFCDKKYTFKTFSKYQEHLKQHSRDWLEVSIKDEVISEPDTMELPDKSFYLTEEVKPPIVKDTMEMPKGQPSQVFYECDICLYTTYKKFNYRRHLQNHTKGDNVQRLDIDSVSTQSTSSPIKDRKQHVCDQCGKTFKSSCGLQLHKKSKHLGEYAHICDVCGKGYNQKIQFKFHVASHASISLTECCFCKKALKGHSSLERHKLICPSNPARTHLDESNNFICDICYKTFKTNDRLNCHIKGKHGPKKYSCPNCGNKYSWRSSLKVHRMNCK